MCGKGRPTEAGSRLVVVTGWGRGPMGSQYLMGWFGGDENVLALYRKSRLLSSLGFPPAACSNHDSSHHHGSQLYPRQMAHLSPDSAAQPPDSCLTLPSPAFCSCSPSRGGSDILYKHPVSGPTLLTVPGDFPRTGPGTPFPVPRV